jgi:hypothetical protein
MNGKQAGKGLQPKIMASSKQYDLGFAFMNAKPTEEDAKTLVLLGAVREDFEKSTKFSFLSKKTLDKIYEQQ